MRNTTVKIMVVAMLMMLSRYGSGAPVPQEDKIRMESMTVAELERAGDEARAAKDYAQAIRYFKVALKKDRRSWVLYNKLGMSELKNNGLEAARSDFKRAVKQNSKYADAVNNIGAVDFLKKDFDSAAKYFKKAIALDETRPAFHVNLGDTWFSQNKLKRAVAEYTRALELDSDALRQSAKAGVTAQIASPEEIARYSYILAKIYAKRGDVEGCLQCLKKAKEAGYRDLANVYKDEAFSRMWENPRLHQVVAPPTPR